MFRCAVTGEVSAPREAMHRVVINTRKVMYTNRVKREDEDGKVTTEVVLSNGWEIVKEVGVTQKGLDILNGKEA